MRNLLAYLLLAILLLVGSWYYTCKVKNLCDGWNLFGGKENTTITDDESVENGAIEPSDLKSAYISVFDAENNVVFRKSEDTIEKGEDFDSSLSSIADFLNNHPETNLTITGAYADDEYNISDFEEMGQARADQIKQELMALGVIETQLLINSRVVNDLFLEGDLATSDDLIDFEFSERYSNLNDSDIKKAYRSLLDFEYLITFYKNDKSVLLLEGSDEAIQNVAYYLNQNKDQKLTIVMPYMDEEAQEEGEESIGMQRAIDLKNKLAAGGIDEDKIVFETEETLDIFDDGDAIKPGSVLLNFSFTEELDEEKIAEMELEQGLENALNDTAEEEDNTYDNEDTASKGQGIEGQQPTMKFRMNETEMMVNDRVIYYLCDLRSYLNDNPSKTVLITGHTDNMGDELYNDYLGMERAKNGQLLFKKRCIPLDKIEVQSAGESNPIADNATAAGRRLNRRIEIDIR